ncbi:hypothetical protein GCM10027030_28150 [Luteococcus sediminum]
MSSIEDLIDRTDVCIVSLEEIASGRLNRSLLDTLQRGVAVSCFQSLERFIEDRGREWSDELDQQRVSAKHFPDDAIPFLKRAVSCLPYAMSHDSLGSRQIIREVSASLATFDTTVVKSHQLAFAKRSSNYSETDIASILAMLGSKDPWGEMTQFWRAQDQMRNGSIKALFTAAADARHEAAHESMLGTPLAVLNAMPAQILQVALSFDVVGSQYLRQFPQRVTQGTRKIKFTLPCVRTLTFEGTTWAEYRPGNSRQRAVKRSSDYTAGWELARQRAAKNREVLVAIDSQTGNIRNWLTT